MSPALWVTGLGLVTPLGTGVEATWSRLVRGESAIGPVRGFDVRGQRSTVAAEVQGVVAEGDAWSRTTVMAAKAAEEALRQAGIDPRTRRVGLVLGGTTGGMFETEGLLARLHADPDCHDALSAMLSHPLTATGDRLVERLGPFARVRTLSSACSSGAIALVVAASWLRAGEVDAVVAGGTDGLCRLTFSGFNALCALDPAACRPFHRDRKGTTLAEGAGMLVLERATDARARGAKAVAELAGWAAGSEAHHITMPAPSGEVVARLVHQALARAALTPGDVDYVNAHGTGTPANDAAEATALGAAFGADIDRIPVSSSKGQLGHALGAAGAIEAAITALVVQRRTLVPTVGLDAPDPAVRLVHVPHVGREVSRVRAALSCAFGFGGMDAVLVFTPPREPVEAKASVATVPVVVTGTALVARGTLTQGDACASILAAADGAGQGDPTAHLDATRARRLDLSARLAVVATQAALEDAGAPPPAATGVVLGSAFGSVDGSAGFMHRILDRGPRAASPAEFPNLVPSSPVGHASIFLGLEGASFATADLGVSAESAFVQAVQLVGVGEAERLVAGCVEPPSDIVTRTLAAMFSTPHTGVTRDPDPVAATLVVESLAAARARGAAVRARVVQALEHRGAAPAVFPELVAPEGPKPVVVLAYDDPEADAVLGATPWRKCARVACAPPLHAGDGLGGVALAVAVARVASGQATSALVLGVAPGRAFAIVLGAAHE